MTKKKDETSVLTFSKEQIITSKKYRRFKDFLNGNLKDHQMYLEAELNELIVKNYKKGIGEK